MTMFFLCLNDLNIEVLVSVNSKMLFLNGKHIGVFRCQLNWRLFVDAPSIQVTKCLSSNMCIPYSTTFVKGQCKVGSCWGSPFTISMDNVNYLSSSIPWYCKHIFQLKFNHVRLIQFAVSTVMVLDWLIKFFYTCYLQLLALLTGVLLEKQVVIVCPNLVSF